MDDSLDYEDKFGGERDLEVQFQNRFKRRNKFKKYR